MSAQRQPDAQGRSHQQDDCDNHLSAPQQPERDHAHPAQHDLSRPNRIHGALHGYGLPLHFGEVVAVIGPAEDRGSRVGGAAR